MASLLTSGGHQKERDQQLRDPHQQRLHNFNYPDTSATIISNPPVVPAVVDNASTSRPLDLVALTERIILFRTPWLLQTQKDLHRNNLDDLAAFVKSTR